MCFVNVKKQIPGTEIHITNTAYCRNSAAESFTRCSLSNKLNYGNNTLL